MQINVSRISKYEGNSLTFSFSDPEKSYKYDFNGEDLSFKAPVTVTGGALSENQTIKVNVSASAVAVRTCGRCLVTFEEAVSMESDFTFVKQMDEDHDDFYEYENDMIDLTEPVLGELALALNMKPLCSETCKGLCHHCGMDLNQGSCDCDQGNIDPRFAALSKFFDTDQGGV